MMQEWNNSTTNYKLLERQLVIENMDIFKENWNTKKEKKCVQYFVDFIALNNTMLYKKETDNLVYLQNCLANNCLQSFWKLKIVRKKLIVSYWFND